MNFDPESGNFTASYLIGSITDENLPTVLYLNYDFYYPNGAVINVKNKDEVAL